jgi:hypothetical protein
VLGHLCASILLFGCDNGKVAPGSGVVLDMLGETPVPQATVAFLCYRQHWFQLMHGAYVARRVQVTTLPCIGGSPIPLGAASLSECEIFVRHMCANYARRQQRTAWVHADQAKARKEIAVPLSATAVIAIRERIGPHSTPFSALFDRG